MAATRTVPSTRCRAIDSSARALSNPARSIRQASQNARPSSVASSGRRERSTRGRSSSPSSCWMDWLAADGETACGVGFVVDIKGRKSHAIVSQALTVLKNLLHRGACGCEANTGDGAGILIQMPHAFLRRECARLGFALPEPGWYGAGLVFLPRDPREQTECQAVLERIATEEGQRVLGWRDVRTDDSPVGPTARSVEPVFKQVFIGRAAAVPDRATFERKLYVIRKRAEHAVRASELAERKFFYLPSLSANTFTYKGMLSADQIETMFPDVTDPLVES